VEYVQAGRRTIIACDGKTCWSDLPDKDPQTIPRGKALLDPHFAQAIALAANAGFDSLSSWGDLALDGSDKAGGRLCYRLSVTDAATTELLFVWLSVADDQGRPHIELVKTGVGLDDDEPIAGTLFADGQMTLVRGLAETEDARLAVEQIESLSRVDGAEFEMKGGK
jgi:hypothetical protein